MTIVTGGPPAVAAPPGDIDIANPATPIPFGPLTVGRVLLGGGLAVFGYALIETTGASAAAVELFDGGDATGVSLVPLSFTPGQSVRDWFGAPGIEIQNGLFLAITAGSVRGTIYASTRRTP